MRRFLLFSVFLFLFFTAGFFLDAVFHLWGVFFNTILLWFFIFVSYRFKSHEILYAGALMGLVNSFFAAGPVWWFWFFVFIMSSFVIIAVHFFVSVSGRLKFFSFSFASWAGALLIRIVGIFFAGIRYPGYGKVWNYAVSPFFGWEIGLSIALLLCIAVSAYYTHRSERVYYV